MERWRWETGIYDPFSPSIGLFYSLPVKLDQPFNQILFLGLDQLGPHNL